jgi:predicted RNA-binding Zn ribbon-like protein
MEKLSLNKAAKEAGVAKSTLLEALHSGRMSAVKNDVGHWQIDPAELFRVFPKTSSLERGEPPATPRETQKTTNPASALEVEVKMLREQIERMDSERERERAQLDDQIEALREQAARQSADHRQAFAVLTDQREKVAAPPRRSLWARLVG